MIADLPAVLRRLVPRLLVLAAVSVPGPVVAQSRGQVTDDVDRFMLEHFDRIQPKSVADNLEYCGLVGFDAEGELRVTPARAGTEDGCEPGTGPAGWEVIASWHTHGAFLDEADSEVPSSDDMVGDMSAGIDGYVATPGGRVWLIVAAERITFQICGRGCVAADPKARSCKTFTPAVQYTTEDLRALEEKPTEGC